MVNVVHSWYLWWMQVAARSCNQMQPVTTWDNLSQIRSLVCIVPVPMVTETAFKPSSLSKKGLLAKGSVQVSRTWWEKCKQKKHASVKVFKGTAGTTKDTITIKLQTLILYSRLASKSPTQQFWVQEIVGSWKYLVTAFVSTLTLSHPSCGLKCQHVAACFQDYQFTLFVIFTKTNLKNLKH